MGKGLLLIFTNTHTHSTVVASGTHHDYDDTERNNLLIGTHTYRAYVFRAEGPIPVIGDRLALLPDIYYSVADGALFIILIKTTILRIHFQYLATR